jgi:anti-anti-sigma regulatory factor
MMHLLIRSSTRSLAFAFIALGLLAIVLDADAQGIDATRLKTLTAEQATDLVKQSKPLQLAVTELSPEVATVLASSKAELHFDALATLTPESAAALAKCEGSLGLPKLAELSPAAAKALAPHTGVLMMGLKELSDETAAALAKRAGDTRLDSLTSLTSLLLAERLGRQTVVWLGSVKRITPEIARALCPPAVLKDGKLGYRWIDIGLTELSPEAAAAVVGSRHGFSMHSLESITPEAATALASPFTNMRMWGLKTISPATATALAKTRGILDIRMFGPELTDDSARAFAAQMQTGPCPAFDFGGLKKLTVPDNLKPLPSLTSLTSAALAAKYARQPGDVNFKKLASIPDDVAKALATHKGKLDLSGVQSLSTEAAKALAGHEGELKLDGVKEISDEAAKALAQAVGAVSLSNLTTASPEAAGMLKGLV